MDRKQSISRVTQMKVALLSGFLGLSLTSLSTQAVDLSFSGRVIKNPPCTVSGHEGEGQPIRVPFGEVGIARIDGENYRQDFAITVTCGMGLGEGVALSLNYAGVPASFDDTAIQASPEGLGIRLFSDGSVVAPNTNIPMILSNQDRVTKTFSAVPVKDMSSSTVLTEGAFSAAATVEMRYP